MKSSFEGPGESDFALFDSGQAILGALFSVGFIGVQDPTTGHFTFCHDGSLVSPSTGDRARVTAVHPCYWKALSLQVEAAVEEFAVQINDEYEAKGSEEIRDQRLKRLGEILGELPRLPLGDTGSQDFEKWVYRP